MTSPQNTGRNLLKSNNLTCNTPKNEFSLQASDSQPFYDNFKPFRHLPVLQQQDQIVSIKNETLDVHDSPKLQGAQTPKAIIHEPLNAKTNGNILKVLKINQLVKKFKLLLLNRSGRLNSNLTKRFQINKLHLEKYFLNKKEDSNGFKEFLVIEPTNKIIIIFDFIKYFLLLSALILIPFNWSFKPNLDIEEIGFSIFQTIIFGIDIFLKLNIAIISKGDIIRVRSEILKKYLHGYLFVDIAYIFMLNYSIGETYLLFLIIFCSLGFIKVRRLLESIVKLFNLKPLFREIVSLVNLLLTVTLIAHFMACLWHYIGMTSMETYQKSWIIFKELQHSGIQERYIFSYYWAIVTMVTVGYGDIVPQNQIEALSCIFLMFLSCGVFTFSINQVGTIIQNINKQKEQFQEMIRILTIYMKQHEIPDQLQSRVKSYLEYRCLQRNQQSKYHLQNILDQLSTLLQQQVMLNVFKHLLRECKLLTLNFSEETICKASCLLQTVYYCPGENIYVQGQSDDCYLYFVDYGKVEIQEKFSDQTLVSLQKGDFFGDESFFTDSPRKLSAISKSFTKVLRISPKQFMTCLNQDDLEAFHQVKSLYLFNLPVLGRKCNICKLSDHILNLCPQINYFPDIEKLILLNNNAQAQRITKFKRKKKRTRNAISMAKELKFVQGQIEDNNITIEDEELKEDQGPISITLLELEQAQGNQNVDQLYDNLGQQSKELKISLHQQTNKNNNNESPLLKRKSSYTKESDLLISNDLQSSKVRRSHDSPPRKAMQQQKSDLQKIKLMKQGSQQYPLIIEVENKGQNLTHQTSSHKVTYVEEYDKMKEYKKFFHYNNFHAVLQDFNKKNKQLTKLKRNSTYQLFDHSLKKKTVVVRKARASRLFQL